MGLSGIVAVHNAGALFEGRASRGRQEQIRRVAGGVTSVRSVEGR